MFATMIPGMIAATLLVLATVVIHYEALRMTSRALPRLTALAPRQRLVAVLVAIFAAHTVEVWVYGGAYLVLDRFIDIGGFKGEVPVALHDYVYFSTVTYSSLGYGDLYPTGGLRLVAGVEAINGLLLIGWSASYTYLAMIELWGLHEEFVETRRKEREEKAARRGGSP